MLVTYRTCPHCGSATDGSPAFFLCPRCFKPIQADIGEEELKGSEHKYRVIDASQVREATEEEKPWFAEMEQHMANMGNKPFHFFKMKAAAPASMKKFPTGLLWLGFFALLTIALLIFTFTTFNWYTVIPVIAITAITLFKQKHP